MNRSFRSLSAFALVLAALMFMGGTSTLAQTFRGTILGTVTDTSGASVPGATVTIKNLDTGLVRTVTTSEDGSYSAPELPIGNYNVVVEKSGFKHGVVNGIRVEVSSERRADVTLQPGEVAQAVEVVGDELPQVETTSNTLGGIVESKVVTNLPVNGRDYQKLIFLLPGVAGSPNQITDSPGSYGTFSVNGARGRSNNFLLDGTDMNDGYRNDPAINEAGVFGTPATILPVESIAELRVASNFEAEYGRSAGGVINIVTKSGTNQLHGSVFDFFRNSALDARNYFNATKDQNTGLPIAQNPFHNNQYGVSLGGPILKDKTFFFLDYEGFREKGAESSLACVPTATDISLNAPTPGDPSSIDTVVTKILASKGWPTPNIAGSCLGNAVDGLTAVPFNASLSTPFSNRVDSAIVKIDHSFNANNLLTGRYYIGDSDQSFPLALTGGGLLPNYNTATPTRVQLVSLSYVSNLSPAIVNEARIGWNRFAEGFFPQDRSFDPSSIGLNTVGAGTANNGNKYNFGFPVMVVGPFAQLGADKGDPRQRVDTNWHYIDNISWKRGRHDIKFGYEFRRTSISQIFDRTFRGKMAFDNLSDFLAGVPDGGTQGSGNTNRNTYENSHALYLQDSYRVNRNVTLNLGLRYDYLGIVQEKHGNFTNVDPTNGQGILVGAGRLYQPDYNNFSPRVSLAWDVSGKGHTVVRVGYGIFYDAFSQDLFMGHLPWSSSFDPGPAYSGFGPNPISFSGLSTDGSGNTYAFASGQPVFGLGVGAPSTMGDAFGVDQHIRTPYMENYNLNLQQQLTKSMVFQIGYVGSQGHKLFRFRDINQPGQAAITAADCPNGPSAAPGVACTGGSIVSSVPRVFAATSPFYYIYYEESSANSSYNSLQSSFRINNWHGLTSIFNYTWSHSIDDASDGEDFIPNAAQPTNSAAPIRFNRGNSNFDIRNRLTWNFIYEFPTWNGSWKKLTDGWGLNGIVTVQSGQPFHVIMDDDDYDGAGTFFAKPDVVGPIKYNYHDPTHFLDLTSFAVPCSYPAGGGDGFADTCIPGTRHFGNLGRDSLIGPHFRQFDFSFYKKTQLTERLNLELRFEAYNLFNHPNFDNPIMPLFFAHADGNGISPSGTGQGFLPLTVTGDVGIGYPFLGSGGPRGLQIAAKFSF